MPTTSKLLIIGLDGVPFELLDSPLVKDAMPFLRSLRESGYSASLLSTVPPISATAWSTFATGVNPGKHGVLQFVNLRPGQAKNDNEAQWATPDHVSLLNAEKIRGVTLWQLLSEADRRQVIVNVPLTYPPRPINGIMVTGMLTPPSAPIFTHPPELSEYLRGIGYEIDLSVGEKGDDFDRKDLIFRVRESQRKRRDVCVQFMQDKPWDFFMVVFTETDRIQHRFWKYLVPSNPEYLSWEAKRLRPPLEQYFRELDQAIADLVHMAGRDTRIMVLSDHGFGPAPESAVYSLSMMQALDLAGEWAKSGVMRFRKFIEEYLHLTPRQVRKWARVILPPKWAAKLDARFRDAQLATGARSLAYSVQLHSYIGGIYINRRFFSDEIAFADFRRRVMTDLKRLVDPSTHKSLVAKVYTREELYSGPALDECPDIVFYLAPSYGLTGWLGPAGKLVSHRPHEPNKQGVHYDEGILILQGPGIKAGQGPQEKLQDTTATILYLLDVPIPSAMDSRPLLRVFDPDFAREHPPRYTDRPIDSDLSDDEAKPWITPEDQEKLVRRLRGLGYIE